MMNSESNQTGLRIRAVRKKKGINQSQLATLLGKSLRTVQKYESGEIEITVPLLFELARILDTTPTYLIGYSIKKTQLESFADVAAFLFQLEQIKNLGFNIVVKKPPQNEGWNCCISFNGKDSSADMNQDLCLLLEQFADEQEEYRSYMISKEQYDEWKDETLAYYANLKLQKKVEEELSDEERIAKRNALMNERFGK